MRNPATETDTELAAAWQAGDPKAGARLLRRHTPQLDRYFHTKVGARDAEDLRQETLIRVMDALPHFRFESSFRTYLYLIAYRTLCDRLRYQYTGRGRRDVGSCSLEELHGAVAMSDSFDDEAKDLVAALRTLAADDQVLIELIYFEGLSYAEAAVAMGATCAVGTLRARVHSIKRQLRIRLGDHEGVERYAHGHGTSTSFDLDGQLRRLRSALDAVCTDMARICALRGEHINRAHDFG